MPRQDIYERPKNTEKLKFHMYEAEQTILFSPADYTGNKFLGSWSKIYNL